MFTLDNKAISEILHPETDQFVVSRFESQPRDQLFTTPITEAVILYSIELLINDLVSDSTKALD